MLHSFAVATPVATGFILRSHWFAPRMNPCPYLSRTTDILPNGLFFCSKEGTSWHLRIVGTYLLTTASRDGQQSSVTVVRTSNLTRWGLHLSQPFVTLKAKPSPEKLSKTIAVIHAQGFKTSSSYLQKAG